MLQNRRLCRDRDPSETSGPYLEQALVEAPGRGAQVLQQRALVREREMVRQVARILAVAHLLQEGRARRGARAARRLHALHLRIRTATELCGDFLEKCTARYVNKRKLLRRSTKA